MPKVYVVIRTIGEKTTENCINAVTERFGNDYRIVRDFKPLEMASKETIRIGAELADSFGWIMAVDADVILDKSRVWIEDYCKKMKLDFGDRLFSFTGYVDCTRRGFIPGIHFFRTKFCQEIFDRIKDTSFQHRPGRDESEICWYVRDKMAMGTVQGTIVESFGKHVSNN
jgi:hypothetical protein